MAAKSILFLVYAVLVSSIVEASSILSWLTGGESRQSSIFSPDLGMPLNNPLSSSPYAEENGECAHWGNRILPPYSASDPTYSMSGLSVGGPLIGSHRSAPIGSIVAVTNVNNGKTIKVRVVPPQSIPVMGRIMDLSPAAFSQLGLLSDAVLPCSVKILQSSGLSASAQILSLTSATIDNSGIRKPSFPSPPTLISAGSVPSLRDSFGMNRYTSTSENWSY